MSNTVYCTKCGGYLYGNIEMTSSPKCTCPPQKEDYKLTIPLNIEYLQVIPNSQYFTELEQILACLQLNWDNQEYVITALKNSIAMGYKLTKP